MLYRQDAVNMFSCSLRKILIVGCLEDAGISMSQHQRIIMYLPAVCLIILPQDCVIFALRISPVLTYFEVSLARVNIFVGPLFCTPK